MSGDVRGWRMALIPDLLLNPVDPNPLPDVISALQATGYGLLQLPPPGAHALLLAVTADQLTEYLHHGYAVVAIGVRGVADDGLHWRRLSALLRRQGSPLPPRHRLDPAEQLATATARLADFLSAYDLPPDERHRWRS